MKNNFTRLQFVIVLCMILVPLQMQAKMISVSDARNMAEKCLRELSSGKFSLYYDASVTANSKSEYSVSLSDVKLAYTGINKGIPSFYVFNRVQKGGFVIIAADDRVQTLLGYSDEGKFDMSDVPENMKVFLDAYQEQIGNAVEQSENSVEEMKTQIASDLQEHPIISELLTSEWGQRFPYNERCPIYSDSLLVASGCVATAMAQVMYYWRWPVRGKGQHSYISRKCGYELSADFSKSVYDWDAMTPTYNAESSAEADSAVARLILDCGISVDMNYNCNGKGLSEALPFVVPKSFVEYFCYDDSIKLKHRFLYTVRGWDELIYNELSNKRPVLYFALDSEFKNGHSFVIDGYRPTGYYHVNWGWNGKYNGYYLLNNLTPGTYNYKLLNTAIIGIQKPEITSVDNHQISSSLSDYSKTTVFTLSGVVVPVSGNVPSLSGQTKGIYILRTVDGNGKVTVRKIMK